MAIDIPRETALKILIDINEKGAFSNISLNKYLLSIELRTIDKAFITDLVYGTIKWKLKIDWVIEQFSSVKLKKISPWIMCILRLGVYQLLFTDKVPESAACNESVNLAKKYGHASSRGFVNAILRNISKNRDKFIYPDKDTEPVKYLSIVYSHPEWMVTEWVNKFGYEFAKSLLEANNATPDFIIRTNTLKITPDELMDGLEAEGIEVSRGKYLEEALYIKNPSSVSNLNTFKKGYFQVQDESSMLVAKLLDPRPGNLVIDVCSAPGGKTTHIAELMKNEGKIVAYDIHEHKIKIINESAKRLGIKIIAAQQFDALNTNADLEGRADCVLVDAPCSGLGIIRRKPDIKWSRTVSDKKEIIELQYRILCAASKYLKPEGVLVYSTCTIEREENEGIVEKFLKSNDKFELIDITQLIPNGLRKESTGRGYIQLYPNIDGLDGFFMAKIKRVL